METFRIYRTHFESAHYIEGHPKCGVKHGHSYNLKIKVHGDLNEFLDFHDIKTNVEDLLDKKYDHRDLGNCTCETLAQQIQFELKEIFKAHVDIELFETAKFGVGIVSN